MKSRLHRNHLAVIGAAIAVLSIPLWGFAQETTHPIDSFHQTLDPRVFEPGGYGPWPEPLNPIFDQAAAQYRVPRELLVALGQIGSAFENRGDQPTIERGYGVMALRENNLGGTSLTLAAQLLNSTTDAVKTNPRLNIMGAAAVLDSYAREAKIVRKYLDSWLDPVIRYAGLDAEDSQIFAVEVMQRLQSGIVITNSYGETFSFEAQDITLDLQSLVPTAYATAEAQAQATMSTEYPPAIWDPAASCNYTATATTKDTVICHTIEGSAAGARSWMKNCASSVSSHYVVSEAGTVWQMVDEDYKAWHASCYNSRALGIEHEGYAASSSHPQALYDASALLTRHFCDRWGIPKQKRTVGPGILGHIDVTNCCCGTHTDPGNGWNWTYYIQQVVGAPPTPAWAATYNAQSYPSSMTAGTTAVVWAEFKNTGTSTWAHCQTKLGTSSPQDRSSPFCTPANWACADGSNPGCNRPTDVDQSSVTQNSIGRFTFILTAPSTPGTYTEKFKLVREGVTWFGPEITWTITVVASTGNVSGTVTNASSGATISGATVTLTGVGSTTTNSSGAYSFSGVTAGSYSISASKTSFVTSNSTVSVTAGATATKNFALTPSDTQAPTTPTNLTATPASQTTVQLSWTASTDNVGVTGYEIRRNGTTIGTSTTAGYTDSTCTANTSYTYDVRAKDAVPNYSGWSAQAVATTPPNPPQPTIVFSDGFNGNLNNWTQQTGGFAYSTTQTHGTYTGAGAAFVAAGETDQMYHLFTRPFAQAKAWGYFYDGKGGWKQGTCGWAYRQALSLRDYDNGAKMFIDNCFYSATNNANYFFRLVGAGGLAYTAYATRDPNTACGGAWIYFETTVNPGAPNASPTGTFIVKVTDNAGTTTSTQNLTTDYYDYGVGRITLGLGASSANEGYWDDIALQATPPGVVTMSTPTVLSSNQIRWNFSPADNNLFGYDVANSASTIVSPQWPNAGWINRNASSWTESGLTPNTSYTRKVRAWNGTLNSAIYSATATACTLSPAPVAGSVTPGSSSVCLGSTVTWTAVGGFGAGKVQQYKYAWDQSPTHTFSGSEAVWSSGTLDTTASSTGTWYLHVQGLNDDDVANGTYDYAVTVNPATAINNQPWSQEICVGQTATFTVTATGGNLTYQWQKNGGNLSNGGHCAGVTTPVLTISNVDASDVASYQCVVTGDCGVVTSIDESLTLKDATAITLDPVSQTVLPNSTILLAVDATGGEPLSYQWQKNGVDLVEGGHYYDVTSPTMTIASASRDDNGQYRCIVTGECGSTVSAAAVVAIGAAADFNLDGHVDSTDFDVFSSCYNGPTNPVNQGCLLSDFNSDNFVDSTDFDVFSACYNGPTNPPGC